MIKKISAFVGLLLITLYVFASPVSPEKAARVGLNFWRSKALGINTGQSSVIKTYTISEVDHTLYYIFDIAPKGFVIVTADDASLPILGYSYESYYETDNQPEAFTDWMDNYKAQIIESRSKKLAPDAQTVSAWQYYYDLTDVSLAKKDAKGVNPLLTTRWTREAAIISIVHRTVLVRAATVMPVALQLLWLRS
jgi:hypothetical protein